MNVPILNDLYVREKAVRLSVNLSKLPTKAILLKIRDHSNTTHHLNLETKTVERLIDMLNQILMIHYQCHHYQRRRVGLDAL